MLTGSLIVLYWGLIALIGAVGGLVFCLAVAKSL